MPAGLAPLDPAGAEPPFEQLRVQVARAAASGALPAGTRLPPVRALAAALGVAPGTVARAYRELEADGVVVTEGRRGTSVAGSATAGTPEATRAAAEYAAAARRLGLGLAEAQRLLERAWPR
nr:GntR family transcriptional regulator [Nocardioides perillae]